MLEIKHLCKTYKTKKGGETRAVDDVSIKFPEKGLVFLLGKSGSGKSTLLNLCGGLDRADSGEIIIMNKSSRDFKASDFDSYRNTFVGFVFQEYNILNEFTVEDNIALALELQNKKRDKQQIDEILKSVDLEEFANRKPYTLSGGQKQRVAIARALVKQPRIILADEPTGALDSETGKQVLETLKKLSEDKLVIVVSHDVEFAERYADRIIELKDGKVISDKTRENQSASFVSAVENAQTRIYSEQESAMIRSHLPARHALRMGAASVKLKPVRLVFTVLLSIIAFVIFGLFSTVEFYNEQTITKNTFLNSDIVYLNYQKGYNSIANVYASQNGERWLYSSSEIVTNTNLTRDEYSKLTATYGQTIAYVKQTEAVTNLIVPDARFYTQTYQGFAFAENGNAVTLLSGRLPQNSGEALVSDFTFECMRFGRLIDDSEDVELESYDDYVKIPVQYFCDAPLEIVGVYKAEKIPESYNELKQASDDHLYMSINNSDWQNKEYANGFYSYLLVDESFCDIYKDYISSQTTELSNSVTDYFMRTKVSAGLGYRDNFTFQTYSYINTYDDANGLDLLALYDLTGTRNVTTLSDNQIAMSISNYGGLLFNYLNEEVDKLISEFTEDGEAESAELIDIEYKNNKDEDGLSLYNKTQSLKLYGLPYTHNGTVMNRETAVNYLSEINDFMAKWNISAPQITLSNSAYYISCPAEIAAIYFYRENYSCLYMGKTLYDAFYQNTDLTYSYRYETKYTVSDDACINGVFIPSGQYRENLQSLVKNSFTINDDDSTYIIANALAQDISRVNEIVEGLSYISLWLWLGFTLFAVLLMFNFISASITAKKKEIGILRAIGARSVDVFKIFLSESGIVTAVCLVLSVVICAVLCPVISGAIVSGTAISVSVLVFTPVTFLFMLLVAVFTAVISTIIPVATYAKKPPVDSIRAL